MPTRQQAEERLVGRLPAAAAIRGIDPAALEAFAAQWASSPRRRVSWPWPAIVADYRRVAPERFEAAVWSGEILCGLAIGRPSKAATILAVHFIEGSPDLGHPLKGFAHLAALEAAHAYAVAPDFNDAFRRPLRPYANTLRLRDRAGSRCSRPNSTAA